MADRGHMGRDRQRGTTVMELLVATVLTMLVIMAIGQVDLTRVLIAQEAADETTEASEAALALSHMTRYLQQADRVNLLGPTDVQFRIPIGTVFDNPANYIWNQYRLDVPTQELRFFENAGAGCTVDWIFDDIGALTVQQLDESPDPFGGGPAPDNNVLEFIVDTRYRGEATLRAAAGQNVPNGLAPPGIANPPAGCI